ncbi:hypothetical protein EBR04_01550 [bacterium]|nr:hypothetical protein [bacterium]
MVPTTDNERATERAGCRTQPRGLVVMLVGAVAACICAAVAIAYLPAIGFPFCNLDDHDYIAGNPTVLGGLTAAGIARAFRVDLWLYHPLTLVSLMADVDIAAAIERLTGTSGVDRATLRAVCRIHNVVLHLVNTGLVAAFAARLLGWRQGLAVAALFSLHPLRVEAIVWICERKELLAAAFGLIAVLAYLRYTTGRNGRWYAAAVVAAAASLLAKPTFVTLPGLLLLLDVWPAGRIAERANGGRFSVRDFQVGRCLVEKVPFVLLSAACTAVTLFSIGEGLVNVERVDLGHRVATAVIGYATYPLLDLWPWPLAILYPLKQAWSLPRVWGSAAAVAAVTVAAIAGRGRLPAASFGWWWYLLASLPTSGLIQNGQQAYADRFHYVPGIGLAIAAVAIAAAVMRGLRLPRGAGIAACALAASGLWAVTVAQVQVWRDGETLWRRAVEAVPNNWYALDQHARQLAKRGRHSEAAACWERCYAGLAHRLRYACELAANAHAAGDAEATGRWRAAAIGEPRRRPEDCLAIARLEGLLGNRDEALFAVRQGLAFAPGDGALLAEFERLTTGDVRPAASAAERRLP